MYSLLWALNTSEGMSANTAKQDMHTDMTKVD